MLHAVIDREGWQRVCSKWNEFKVNENDLTGLSKEQQSESMEKSNIDLEIESLIHQNFHFLR